MSTASPLQHEWSLLCQRSIVDLDTNSLSIIDTIEQLTIRSSAPGFVLDSEQPLNVSVQVVSRFRKMVPRNESVNAECRYQVLDPNKKKIGDSSVAPFTVESGLKNMRIRAVLNITIARAGEHIIQVEIRTADAKAFKKVAELPLDVVVSEQ